jgi:hypothetical protein
VQIEGPDGDTFALPSISGIAPGPADPLIIADNNKAQRNLQDTIGTAAGTELIAIVGNLEKERRPMRLRMSIPGDVRISGTFDVVGRTEGKIANGAVVDLGVLAPGEIRFLRFHADSLSGINKPTMVHIFEDTTPPANGFSILLHRESVEKVARRNLKELAGLLERLAVVDRNNESKEHARLTLETSHATTEKTFISFLKANRNKLTAATRGHMRLARSKDTFGVAAAESDLWKAVELGRVELAELALTELIERLDAQITAEVRARGGK